MNIQNPEDDPLGCCRQDSRRLVDDLEVRAGPGPDLPLLQTTPIDTATRIFDEACERVDDW